MDELAALFKGLADTNRLRLLALLLRHGELCVCDLEHTLGVTQSKASRHLRTLKAAGLLEDRRGAQWVFYRITRRPSPAQKLVIAALRRLLPGEELEQLAHRLQQWRARKEASGEICLPASRSHRRNRRKGIHA